MCVAAGLGVVLRLRTHKQLHRDARCGKCGYPREGGFERCPECGTHEKDQRRVWRRKYRWVNVGVLAASVAVGYLFVRGPAVIERGVVALIPSFALVWMVDSAVHSQITDMRHSRRSTPPRWMHTEYSRRIWRDEIPDWQLQWFARRLMTMRERRGLSFRAWENVCSYWASELRGQGIIEEQRLIELAPGRAVQLREWWSGDGTPEWMPRSAWLFQGERERELSYSDIRRDNDWEDDSHFAVAQHNASC